MAVCNCSMFCCTLIYVHSNFAIILMAKREQVAVLDFMVSRDCCVAPHCGNIDLCAVCDCGISGHTYLLFLLNLHRNRLIRQLTAS